MRVMVLVAFFGQFLILIGVIVYVALTYRRLGTYLEVMRQYAKLYSEMSKTAAEDIPKKVGEEVVPKIEAATAELKQELKDQNSINH